MKILPRSRCAILPLVIKGEWYDMIARGWKREEYRDSTPYWAVRLSNWDNTEASAHVVEFRRGYRSDAPRQAYICNIYTSTDEARHPEWGEPSTPHYRLRLGELVMLYDK